MEGWKELAVSYLNYIISAGVSKFDLQFKNVLTYIIVRIDMQ
jgi:hypothetical protein